MIWQQEGRVHFAVGNTYQIDKIETGTLTIGDSYSKEIIHCFVLDDNGKECDFQGSVYKYFVPI